MNIEIKGVSGCKLEVSNLKIRKTSSGLNYNERLKSQVYKQSLFSKISFSNIRVPKILELNYFNNLFYFDMEFIIGENPISHLLYCNVDDINKFNNNIQSFLSFLEKNVIEEDINIFKIKNIEKLKNLNINNYSNFINFIIKRIENIKSKTYPKSICHGDLTLSNMICNKNEIYLIDFLDSYIDTILIDLAKLKQDFYYKWTIGNLLILDQNEMIRISQILDKIWLDIENKFNKFLKTEEFLIIEVMNLLRILPYINDHMKSFIENKIKNTKLYEEFNYTNGWEIN
jgi:tRNA A-37 threonylcarbamoyl transferase component Bud32